MIKATFFVSDNKISLKLNGHAQYSKKGKDIVCASASILAYTLAQTIECMYEQAWISKKDIRLNEGDAVVECSPKQQSYNEVLQAFTMAKVGYQLLSESYPKFVKLKQIDKVL